MRIILYLLLLTPIFTFGQNQKYVYTDSVKGVLELSKESSVSSAYASILYLGDKTDTIQLLRRHKGFQSVKLTEHVSNELDKGQISIYVDTSQYIRGSQEKRWIDKTDTTVMNYPMAYPVVIENISNDTVYVAYNDIIPIKLEAKDENGFWRPIEEKNMYLCGFGMTIPYLLPNQIAVTYCRVFEGDFQTKLRLSYTLNNELYSNEFTGYINKDQFNKNKS
ncbi:hypothetical protein K6119_09440 [Paracrocinitomix mangrovi]|uniref:hypothetical protein n=1 Tax=Paracrocinitomix mangrovi TaxID=2862509 RepID=UPI001C8EAA8C|nr:hypothetical protein [Paracrocinitomix mangrovi]UKN03713.1 hypothetical protein K6119_09440 [Paracrocinitomix mangrovi]